MRPEAPLKRRGVKAMLAAMMLVVCLGFAASFAWAADAPSTASEDAEAATASPNEATPDGTSSPETLTAPGPVRGEFSIDLSEAAPSDDTDSAGTMFTLDGIHKGIGIGGDLYWVGNEFSLTNSLIGNDLILAGNRIELSNDGIDGDLRGVARVISTSDLEVHGVITAAAFNLEYGPGTKATGIYSFGERVTYSGEASRLVLYGQDIYLNGVVEGDATVSAQRIVIGPDARIGGTLYVQSGQYPEVPETASINAIDNTQGNPNAVDQVIELRGKIAPLFQVGGVLFTLVSFIVMAMLGFWIIGARFKDANRVLRRHPVLLLVSGLLCVILLPLFCVLMFALVFTIPVAVVLLLLIVVAALVAVPFTGASLGLLLPERWSGILRVMLGSLVAGALCFIPVINVLVFVFSLIYLFGYVVYSLMAHRGGGDGGSDDGSASSTKPQAPAKAILAPAKAPLASAKAPQASSSTDDGATQTAPDASAGESAAPAGSNRPGESEPESPSSSLASDDAAESGEERAKMEPMRSDEDAPHDAAVVADEEASVTEKESNDDLERRP